MRIARVFPSRTKLSPIDQDAYIGSPFFPEMMPEYYQINISVTFTWDIDRANQLRKEWSSFFPGKVFMGGPAFNSISGNFESGFYLRTGVTITSRGCPNRCKFCLVPEREGTTKELKIVPGNIIQDNNILACTSTHLKKVFKMLKNQKSIKFSGGLESSRITPEIAEDLRSLSIKELWLACDSPNAIKPLEKAASILKKAGFRRDQLRCYCLIGSNPTEEQDRLFQTFELGLLPFAQLYQPLKWIEYSYRWKSFARKWSRPAAFVSSMQKGKKSELLF